MYQGHVRAHILRSGFYDGQYVREELEEHSMDVIGKIYEKVESQRDLIVLKYEKKLRHSLLTALTGKDVDIDENEQVTISGGVEEAYWGARGSFKLGVIPSR